MDGIYQLLFGWWYYTNDGATRTAKATETYMLPLLLIVMFAALIAVLLYSLQ